MGKFSFRRVDDGKIVGMREQVRILIPKSIGGGSFVGEYRGQGAIRIIDADGSEWYLDFFAVVALSNSMCWPLLEDISVVHYNYLVALVYKLRALVEAREMGKITKCEFERSRLKLYKCLGEAVSDVGVDLVYYKGVDTIIYNCALPYPLRLVSTTSNRKGYESYKGKHSPHAYEKDASIDCSVSLLQLVDKVGYDCYAPYRKAVFGTADVSMR